MRWVGQHWPRLACAGYGLAACPLQQWREAALRAHAEDNSEEPKRTAAGQCMYGATALSGQAKACIALSGFAQGQERCI